MADESPHSTVPSQLSVARASDGAGLRTSPGPSADFDPWRREGDRRDDGARLNRLLWIFVLLTTMLLTPSLIGRIEYARTNARERARLQVARENLRDFKLDQLSAAYRMLADSVGPCVVSIRAESPAGRGVAEEQGSGVIVDAEGYIVTNNHVVDGVDTVEIQLSDGRRGTASVVGVDRLTDIAVLRTTMGDLVAAEWGESDEAQVGDVVWAVGSPFGLQRSITFGILSAKERRGMTDRTHVFGGVIQEFLQTDAAVNPGNSGGPLVNYEGKVIGINTAIIGQSYQGISFAVPSQLARASYEQLRKNGYVSRGFLGVRPEELPDELARELGIKRTDGVLIAMVSANTPASEAGLRPLDVIIAWNGVKFADPTLLSRAIAATPIGTDVPVKLLRASNAGPKEMDVVVTVSARPKDN